MTAIDSQTIAVFGGLPDPMGERTGVLANGYLLNIQTRQVKPILGGDLDFGFACLTATQQVGPEEYITVGGDRNLNEVQMIKFFVSHDCQYFETRSIHHYGRP